MDALDIISLDSAKNWLNIESGYTDDDATIERLIKAAVDWVEKYTCWRTYQRQEVVYNRQDNYYMPLDYFPDYGTGFYTGSPGIHWTPKALSIYLYPFTVVSVQDQGSPPSDVLYTTQRNALKTLLYALPNSVITLTTGFAVEDIAQIPPPLIEAAYKWITYLYENRDSYKADLPTDIQILINQYRRALI
jgi:hypothetical protein